MSLFWTLPGPGTTATGTTPGEQADQLDRLWGHDLWLDVADANGGDLDVTPAGDYRLVSGRDALRQALIRRLITDPGECAFLPDYGVGAGRFVKARNSRANRDALAARIRAQFTEDDRVASVELVELEPFEGGLRIGVTVRPIGDPRPLPITVEVT